MWRRIRQFCKSGRFFNFLLRPCIRFAIFDDLIIVKLIKIIFLLKIGFVFINGNLTLN
jgi:hypothetical protein